MYSIKISDELSFYNPQLCALTNKSIHLGFFIEVEVSSDTEILNNKWGFYISNEAIETIGLNSEDPDKANDYREYFYERCPEFIKYPYRLLSDIRFAIEHYC